MRYKESLLLPFLLAINIILPVTAQEKSRLKIGGALRFNYNYSDWKPESRNRGGEFDFDVLRLNVNASYKKIDLAVDYRFYPSSSGGGMLREGWIGYRFNDSHRLQIGLTTVPFGVLPYTGNNYFFNLNYYAGLEDDEDITVSDSLRHLNNKSAQLAAIIEKAESPRTLSNLPFPPTWKRRKT